MPQIRYFDSFPTIQYDMYKDKKTREVDDILRRVRIREDFKDLVATYSTGELVEGERPDIVATKQYGRPELHYILMMLNGVVDPYHDWVKDYKTLENYILQKYPDRSLLFTDASRDVDEILLVNETITGSPSGATGTVVKFDMSLLQLTSKLTSTANFASGDTITGGTSADSVVVSGTPTYEWDGVHHYEMQQEQSAGTTNHFIVDNTVTTMKVVDDLNDNAVTLYNLTTVTNYDYETNKNEQKRKILLLDEGHVAQFEQEFKDKIQR